MSAVAITLRTSTPPSTSMPPTIRSSNRFSPVKTGAGATLIRSGYSEAYDQRREKTMSNHSCVLVPHLKQALTSMDGKYGRMFPDLPAQDASESDLMALGAAGSLMDATMESDEASYNNPRIPAGWPIFGQFIAHDITSD